MIKQAVYTTRKTVTDIDTFNSFVDINKMNECYHKIYFRENIVRTPYMKLLFVLRSQKKRGVLISGGIGKYCKMN